MVFPALTDHIVPAAVSVTYNTYKPKNPLCVFVSQKTAADGKRQEIIVLDSKRSNAINIGLTVLPPPRTIKTAILNFDEYALNKEGIEVRDTGDGDKKRKQVMTETHP